MANVTVGLLGCGIVGGGVLKLLRDNEAQLTARLGARLEVKAALVRDVAKAQAAGVDPKILTTDPEAVLSLPGLDVVVEVMGGVTPARSYVERAMARGSSVVTANKMLLATHGPALVSQAVTQGVDLAFEGSVGGGIPVLRVLKEALAGDTVASFAGIVNGTCNYILTRMQEQGLPFEDAVVEAQDLGYAEADPSLDVDGHDAAHKLSVLAMLAFRAQVPEGAVPVEGIRPVEPIDHRFARRFGFAIKHLALGRDHGAGGLELRVHPALVRRNTALANVNGVLNAVALEGRALGPCVLSGRGAGALPTAVSVVADIVDVASARLRGASGLRTKGLAVSPRAVMDPGAFTARYYLRFQVFDRPGVLARITGALGERRVSIEQMVQEGGGDAGGQAVQVVLLTHEAEERAVAAVVKDLADADFVAAPTRTLRIHDEP